MKTKPKSKADSIAGAARVQEKAGNVTHEKLASLPFKSAAALKQAQEEVRLMVWRRLEEAKVLNEYLQREEYAFWREEFKEGLICAYGEKSDENLVRVFSNGIGIKVSINRSLAEAAPSSEVVLGTLVEAMSRSFAATFYKAKGILAASEVRADEQKTTITK